MLRRCSLWCTARSTSGWPGGGCASAAPSRSWPTVRSWHLWSRWQRKLLSHTLAVYLCQQAGLGSLRFADLLSS
jgi:hypothetical protein